VIPYNLSKFRYILCADPFNGLLYIDWNIDWDIEDWNIDWHIHWNIDWDIDDWNIDWDIDLAISDPITS